MEVIPSFIRLQNFFICMYKLMLHLFDHFQIDLLSSKVMAITGGELGPLPFELKARRTTE